MDTDCFAETFSTEQEGSVVSATAEACLSMKRFERVRMIDDNGSLL